MNENKKPILAIIIALIFGGYFSYKGIQYAGMGDKLAIMGIIELVLGIFLIVFSIFLLLRKPKKKKE